MGVGQYCARISYEHQIHSSSMSLDSCKSHCDSASECKEIVWNYQDDSPGCTLLDCELWRASSIRPTQERWSRVVGKIHTFMSNKSIDNNGSDGVIFTKS